MFKQRVLEQSRSTHSAEGSRVGELPSTPLQVGSVVEGLATAEVGRTCILLWRGVVNESRFRLQRDAIEQVAHRYPGDAAILCIIEPTSEPPPQALREAASALLNQLAPRLRCVAYVIEGTGFRAATIRGVLSGIELVRRSAYPARYFASVADAAVWITMETGRPRAELTESAHRLREQLNVVDGKRPQRASGTISRWPGR
jgi:hypothetical protein